MTKLVLTTQQSKAFNRLVFAVTGRLFITHLAIMVILILLVLAIGLPILGDKELDRVVFHEPKGILTIFLVQAFIMIAISKLLLQRFLSKPLESCRIIIPEQQTRKFSRYSWKWFFIVFALILLSASIHLGGIGPIIAYYIATRMIVTSLLKSGDATLEITQGYLL